MTREKISWTRFATREFLKSVLKLQAFENIQFFCESLIFYFQLLATKLYGGIEP
jgi:hypothetical protein